MVYNLSNSAIFPGHTHFLLTKHICYFETNCSHVSFFLLLIGLSVGSVNKTTK